MKVIDKKAATTIYKQLLLLRLDNTKKYGIEAGKVSVIITKQDIRDLTKRDRITPSILAAYSSYFDRNFAVAVELNEDSLKITTFPLHDEHKKVFTFGELEERNKGASA